MDKNVRNFKIEITLPGEALEQGEKYCTDPFGKYPTETSET